MHSIPGLHFQTQHPWDCQSCPLPRSTCMQQAQSQLNIPYSQPRRLPSTQWLPSSDQSPLRLPLSHSSAALLRLMCLQCPASKPAPTINMPRTGFRALIIQRHLAGKQQGRLIRTSYSGTAQSSNKWVSKGQALLQRRLVPLSAAQRANQCHLRANRPLGARWTLSLAMPQRMAHSFSQIFAAQCFIAELSLCYKQAGQRMTCTPFKHRQDTYTRCTVKWLHALLWPIAIRAKHGQKGCDTGHSLVRAMCSFSEYGGQLHPCVHEHIMHTCTPPKPCVVAVCATSSLTCFLPAAGC